MAAFPGVIVSVSLSLSSSPTLPGIRLGKHQPQWVTWLILNPMAAPQRSRPRGPSPKWNMSITWTKKRGSPITRRMQSRQRTRSIIWGCWRLFERTLWLPFGRLSCPSLLWAAFPSLHWSYPLIRNGKLTPCSDYGVLWCLPHRQFPRPTCVPEQIWCVRRRKRPVCRRDQVAVCASSFWAARCAYRRLPRRPTHQPDRIPLRHLDWPDALKRLHLYLLLRRFASSYFRGPASWGLAMGHFHRQRAGILQRDRTDQTTSPSHADATDVLGDWQYHRWCRHLPLQHQAWRKCIQVCAHLHLTQVLR